MGHANEHVAAQYGTGYDPTTLYKAISKVGYADVDLKHLYPRR